jgi:hypothetical protein
MAKVTFHPQAWINDYATDVDPEGPTEFEVADEEVVGLKDDSFESDVLREHANAPKWIRDWTGPSYITIEPPQWPIQQLSSTSQERLHGD